MNSPTRLHLFRRKNIGFVLAALFLLSFGLVPTAHAQQANADIQATGDGTLSSNLSVEANPGQTVTIELFATGFDGSIGINAVFDLDNPDAIASVDGERKLGFSFPPTFVKLKESQLTFEEGGLTAATETGSDLKLVGVVTITLAESFTTLNLTLSSMEISYLTKEAVTLTPNTKLTVINVATLPRTLEVDLDPADGNSNQLSGRYNPGERAVVQLYGSGLKSLLSYEVHAVVDTPAIDAKNTQFFARTPFTVTPSTGGSTLPTATASASPQGGADIQIATPGGAGDNAYSTSSLEVSTTAGTTANPSRVAVEIYGTGATGTVGFEARFKVNDPAAIQSVAASVTGAVFNQNLPGATKLEGDEIIVNLGLLGGTDLAGDPQLLGTLLITLSSNFNGLSLSLPNITFLPGNETVTANAVLNIKPTGGVTAPTVEVDGRTIIGRASTPTGIKGSNVRLGRFAFLTGSKFRGGTITITKVVFTPETGEPITVTPNTTLNLRSVVTDAPLVTEPPVPVTVAGTRALIRWTTNKPSSSLVKYGTSASTLTQQVNVDELVTVHRVLVEGLTLDTRYFFQVTSTDNQQRTSDASPRTPGFFTTRSQLDILAPRIVRGPAPVGVTVNSAEIVFDTNEAANVVVTYGTAADALTNTQSQALLQLNHQIPLSGLATGTQVFYKISVTDVANNAFETPNALSFTTRSSADTQAPRILGRPSLIGRNFNGGVVGWNTNEASNSAVFFGNVKADVDAIGPATSRATTIDSVVVQEAVTQHKIALTNILSDTTFYFKVRSIDASGNIGFSPETFNFTTTATEDTTAPRIVRPPVLPRRSNTEAVIAWETNEPATSQVRYDTTTTIFTDEAAGDVVTSPSFTQRHQVLLTNLTAGKKYYFQVSSTDLSGNGPTANQGELSFATRAVADEKAPVVFSRPVALGITPNSAIINWGADEPHSAIIRYRKATAPKQAGSETFTDSANDINLTRSHTVTLDGLDLGTAYEYEVETIDADGNTSTSKNLRFTTAATEDTTPPTIVRGPVVRNIRTTSVTIDWFTDEPSDSKVSYGLTSNYTDNVEDITGTRFHSVTLTDLTPGKLYHYAVGSADQSGNVVTTDASGTVLGLSADHTFSTPSQEQTNSPIFLEGPFVEFTNEIVIVKWKTDQLSTSSVVIGVAPGSSVAPGIPVFGENSQFVVESNDLVDNHSVTITGLTPASGYLFQASSTNASGLTTSSSDPTTPRKLQPPGGFGSFTTNTEADSQFPVITGGPTVVASTTSTLTVEWQTDESSNSVIQFGGSAESLTNEEVEGTNVTTHRTVLTKLAPGATYAYKVASTDATGNGATESQVAYGTTPSDADLTAPVITSINNASDSSEPIYKTDRSAAIRWVTNEAASASVAFGTAADNLSDVRSLSDFNTEHNVTLTNLEPSTTYFYQVSSSDQNNNGPTKSTVAQFTTDAQPDGTAPQITAGSVKASAGDKTATITWDTNELSDSAVEYGLSGGTLGFNVGDATDVTKHSVTLTNLTPETEYSFIVKSFDRSNNESAAIDPITFTTFAEGQTPAPDAPAKPTATGGNASVRLAWDASISTGVTGYLVQRAASGADYSSIASVGATTSYVDATAQNGTAYTYQVVALGAQQAQSAPSTASDAVTPGTDKGPAAPTFSHIQGNRLTPTLVINNATGDNLSYVFQVSTSAEFTDAVALASGLAPGAGLGSSDPSGVTAWTVDRTLTDGTTYHYRVKSSDGTFDSAYLTGNFTAKANAIEFTGDISGDKQVNLSDFIRFAQSFGKTPGQDGYNALADITGDSNVNLADFIQFAQSFGRKYIQGPSSGKLIAPAVLTYGINPHAQLQLVGRPVSSEAGAIFTVDAKISNAENLQGYALRIQYDPSTLWFKSASNGKDNLLEQDGRLAELFGTLSHDPVKGEILLASTVTYGAPAEGDGILARLRFDLLQEHPQGDLAHIAEGILIDGRFNADLAQNLGGRLSLVPDAFALEHNYPNPFNPETTIRYAVPEAGKVTLRIYNVLGQEVATLVNTDQVAGYYSVHWNGMDRLGRSVASGVYLYRMEAQNFTRVHKMLLLK